MSDISTEHSPAQRSSARDREWCFRGAHNVLVVGFVASFAISTGCVKPYAVFPSDPRAANMCSQLDRDAAKLARRQTAFAWTLGVLGAGAASAGSTIMPLTAGDDGLSGTEQIVASSLLAGSVLLLAGARSFFNRAESTSKLAAEAASAIAEEFDPENPKPYDSKLKALSRCNRAIALWEASRTDAAEFANALLKEERAAEQTSDAVKATVAEIRAAGALVTKLSKELNNCAPSDAECISVRQTLLQKAVDTLGKP